MSQLSEETQLYTSRNYRQGDEAAIARLFNEAFSQYAGFVPRTPEYWQWCCLNRPTVENDGIRIVLKSGKIVAYTVVAAESVGGKIQANVLEFCYVHDESEAPVRNLVEWITEYAEKMNADAISFDAPTDDNLLRKIVREHGFTELPHVIPLMLVNDFAGLMQKIATSRNIPTEWKDVLHVHFIDGTTLPNNFITLEIDKGQLTARQGKVGTATINIATTVTAFTSCLFGVSNPTRAVLRRRIKVKPFWKSFEVAKLLSTLNLTDRWFIPAADYG